MRRQGGLLLVAVMASACTSTVLYSHSATGTFTSHYFDEPEWSVAVDYRGSGSCLGLGFSLVESPEYAQDPRAPAVITSPIVTTAAPHVSGTWELNVRPSRYQLRGGIEGCAWSVTVRFAPPNQAPPGRDL